MFSGYSKSRQIKLRAEGKSTVTASNFRWLRNENHVKFTVEYVIRSGKRFTIFSFKNVYKILRNCIKNAEIVFKMKTYFVGP